MLLVAHRTPRSRAACETFIAAGANMFECDVQFRGRTVVVSHFLPFLGRRGWLEHDNAQFRWRKGMLRRDPVLLDALDMIPSSCGILLDPKETEPNRRARLVHELARLLPERDRFRVSTDRGDDLTGFRAAGFQTWRTIKNTDQLADAIGSGPLPDLGVSVRHHLVDAAAVAGLRKVTETITTWTVNSAERAVGLRVLDVDGMTTDSLDVMRAVSGS
ncbi:MAG: glycerophosphodiester phosphodiesterase [Jatrophihabitans sp.]